MPEVQIRTLDLVVIGLYLAGMAWMGAWFSRRNNSTEEYFVGNRSFPAWALGLSMLGTSISSVTFLAFPADAYRLDWRPLVSNLTLPMVAVLAIIIFIPFFRRGQLTSAFEYLEARYGTGARLYGTLSFILLQLIRLAKVLALVSIPVSLLTGIDVQYIVIAVGLFIAFYTVAGGFDAVIWTDVVQSVVLWFGGLLCVGYIVWQLPDGLDQIFEVAAQERKFDMGSMEFSWTERTFWTVAMIGIFNWLAMYSSDQTFVQRYAAAKSLSAARKATALYSAIAVPTWAFFFFVGTCVFVFYHAHPDEGVANLEPDAVFPYFILTRIPAGLAGLVIAGVLAAAMSSLDSSINAIATVATVDLLKPYLTPGRSDRFYLNTARWIAIAASGLMITGAYFISVLEKASMNDLSWIVASIFGGCLMGLFLMGFFTRRVDSAAALVALSVAIIVNVYLGVELAGQLPEGWPTVGLHVYWVGMVVNLVFVALAYTLGWLRWLTVPSENRRDLTGLTVWTLERRPREEEGTSVG